MGWIMETGIKTWVVSDTHFHHDKLTEYCGRPVDFTSQIVRNWCACIKPNDLVFHLGDVGFYNKSIAGKLIQGLPGNKILIRGNHDRFPIKWYLDHGFMTVMDTAIVHVCYTKGQERPRNTYYKVILSHIPVSIPEGVDFNLHGHFHNNSSRRWEEEMTNTLTPKHRLVSIEELSYAPIPLGWGIHHDKFINSYKRAQELKVS